ncbi:ankyrin repeat-containing protein BDA1-like [Punica granatum]|uniref:Ankyrin repeat-containing protein BDA1-like n=1 Tax=Punica granatum TaxID=22663 RepID=A0A6P8BP67_PUNGR|nr:ankyrin repeat-containing protein BDA1-like [Punica granatum]
MYNGERLLHDAAVEGNVPLLLRLLEEDRLALHRVASGSLNETPLHVAAMLGHLEFVEEILTRNPEMARELDFRRSSPLHLAAAKGHTEVVKLLLLTNPKMSLSRDWEGRCPIHLAVIRGHTEVLKELIQVKPEAALPKIGSRNILHLCVMHYQYEALEYLVETMGDDNEFMNTKDDDGSTILHLAAADQQVEVVKLLLTKSQIKRNVVNHQGSTSLDLALARGCGNGKDVKIQQLLKREGAIQATGITSSRRSASIALNESNEPPQDNSQPEKRKKIRKKGWLEQKRSALMVVASLIATMAYQAGINPPANIWPGKSEIVTTKNSREHLRVDSFAFIICNSASFYASLSIILLLISGLPLRWRFFMCLLMVVVCVAVVSVMLAYENALRILSVASDLTDRNMRYGFIWIFLIGIIFIGHTVRLVVKMARRNRRRIKRQRGNYSPSQEPILV